ncbi:MAG: glycerophosphodiester phosphodiesterase [Firmicutes bacterium HGW-Firmicutes-1]|jgi:glycerophosphoryl diester phosphodiesterase|nr:MAG: glycerophosphodiester phosphodiesterase [Firmicutes bacterium HGW-Firmicutes-1]
MELLHFILVSYDFNHFKGGNIMIIGHKGTAVYAPENTISAINKAIEMGLNHVEIDVQLSKDEEVVVIHDYTLDRTTNGKGAVRNTTLADMKCLSAGGWFGEAYEDEKIPTLDEVLCVLPEDVTLNVEIKNIARERGNIEERVLELIEKHKIQDQVIISSFDHVSLKKVRTMNETIRIGVLIYAYWLDPWSQLEVSRLKPYSIHPAIEYLDKEFVIEAKKRGYAIFPYTVNSREEYSYCIELGVDGVFSDYPNLVDLEE